MSQLSFSDIELRQSRKPSRVAKKLEKIENLVDWDEVLQLVRVVDRTNKIVGGAPHRDLLVKVKMLFLQHLYNLSDPELEDQVNDRLSFQHFAGINYTTTVPDFTTIWRFKDALIREGLNEKLFGLILRFIEEKGLLLKKGTSVDATKALSKEKRKELETKPSSQIDTDAHSTVKRGKKYFGYKGHIGTDVGSDLIRKKVFTSARPHDSQLKDELLSGDEEMVFGDSAYGKIADKRKEGRRLLRHAGQRDKKEKTLPDPKEEQPEEIRNPL